MPHARSVMGKTGRVESELEVCPGSLSLVKEPSMPCGGGFSRGYLPSPSSEARLGWVSRQAWPIAEERTERRSGVVAHSRKHLVGGSPHVWE